MGRKKKNPSTTTTAPPPPTTTTAMDGGNSESSKAGPNGVDPSVLVKRAHELKEEGNRLFQAKDYAGALHHYDLALKLTPRSHPDRAVFHSNRAACLLLMPPVDHRAVAHECSLALVAQPNYPRALLRRARALDALGDPQAALADLHSLLSIDPSNKDALDFARRLRSTTKRPNSQVPNSQLPDPNPPSSRPSPAALGASAVSAPIAGLGPCLPSRGPSASKKTSPPPHLRLNNASNHTPSDNSVPNEARPPQPPPQKAAVSLKLPGNVIAAVVEASQQPPTAVIKEEKVVGRMRPLKLVYDHDIRLAQMPVNCGFRVLREIVGKRFPCSKAVLVKYKDLDGDLVTVTCTEELRMAESYVDVLGEGGEEDGGKKGEKHGLLRLYIVEVTPEQEPVLPEEEDVVEEEERPIEQIQNENPERSEGSMMGVENGITGNDGSEAVVVEEVVKEKVDGHKECNHPECKEAEMDDWLFEFAQLFRTHVGIDPDAHLDLQELGNELCSEALEETVTSEEAQILFEMAASKFQEVAALAYFNWGNVHMCSARKKIALDESAPKDVLTTQLQSAYDWIKERYILAGQKYEEALRIKPDFYEGLLALGQQHFESAKLQWSFAQANKVDLATWDSTETLGLFDSAEEKMKTATEIWEKLEEQRSNEVKDPATIKREELLKRRKKHDAGSEGQTSSNLHADLSPEEAAEQAVAMRSQIHLFWGNLLYERSQVEFKLGISGWKKNFDDAIERFKLAGASETDVAVVIKNHSSNEASSVIEEKKVVNLVDASETNGKDEDKHIIMS